MTRMLHSPSYQRLTSHITLSTSHIQQLHNAVYRKTNQGKRHLAATRCSAQPEWYTPNSMSSEELGKLYRERQSEATTSSETLGSGAVYLVGTGPGDPELLTMKAVRALQNADVVLYDRLVSEDILDMVNPNALMVYVGKQRSYHTRSQEEIHELLGVFAQEGASVVRLKGGDPYVFGRGGEEVEYLEQQGVTVHVIPGITAASGISAELGIPLTHRGLATSVRFLTGHARNGGQDDLDAAVATANDPFTTLVIYMGLTTLERMAGELIEGGLPADTPAVAVERGTTPEQRAVYATLQELSEQVAKAELKSPTLLLIGKVVALSPGWKRCQQEGRSLDVPGAQNLMMPRFGGGLKPLNESMDENDFASGWRFM